MSGTRRLKHSGSRRPDPDSSEAISQYCPWSSPRTAFTSSLVNTTGSRRGFRARITLPRSPILRSSTWPTAGLVTLVVAYLLTGANVEASLEACPYLDRNAFKRWPVATENNPGAPRGNVSERSQMHRPGRGRGPNCPWTARRLGRYGTWSAREVRVRRYTTRKHEETYGLVRQPPLPVRSATQGSDGHGKTAASFASCPFVFRAPCRDRLEQRRRSAFA